MAGFTTDERLEESTNKWMAWGVVLMALFVLAFPLYRWFEPANREEARESHVEALAEKGASIWSLNCASCHGLSGEGGIGPALNSQQFLAASSDDQARLLISVGVPGSQMAAYALDYGGPLTSEQIKSVVTFIRSWEEDAPDVPDWREPAG